MTKLFIQFIFISFFLSACFYQPDETDTQDLSKAAIAVKPETINLVIDTKSIHSGVPIQVLTFTNIGQQPVTQLAIKGFKDKSAPLTVINTCGKDLSAGGSCNVKVRLNTNYKFASSGPVSRSTIMLYEYNNGEEKKMANVKVSFKVEKWTASMFLTDINTSGKIKYQMPENLPEIKAGTDSADYYCQVDKNNPRNGYTYYALLYDTTDRTPYLHWVLIGGQTYFSVMPKVYHQKVWQTAYKQATVNDLLSQVYNCISKNCVTQATGDAGAWIGLQADNNSLDTNTCGMAGNAWKTDINKFYGKEFALKFDLKIHSMTRLNSDANCDLQKKIICVSM